uniref:Uncharacterized protein n=1 Tax=Panagrolaimus sp. PS1159 TaxID=55785 RepID=A0AC35ERM8_9BILA
MSDTVDIEVGKKDAKTRILSNTTVNTAAELGEKKVTFADVVRTTTIIKKWLLSVQHEDEGYQDDQMSEINTSLVFEPAGLSRTPSRATSLMNSIADLSIV